MMQLNIDQQRALQALALQRDLAQVGTALARAFPEVATRLGERQAALLELGWQRAQAWGLTHGLALARYLAAWFVFGAECESKPGFEWAQAALDQGGRDQGLRIFQLGRRAREALQRRSAAPGGLPTPEAFDQALALLDSELAAFGAMGSLLPRERLRLGSACDLDAVDLTLVAQDWRQHYALEQGAWRRLPTPLDPDQLRVMAVQGQSALPPQLHLLSQASGGQAQLRLRCRAAHCCDPLVHPLADFNSARGQYERRGTQTQDLLLTLPADVQLPPQAAMATEGGASLSVLRLAGCGLRDSGAPMGEQSVQLAVYPATQSMLAWRRERAGAIDLPAQTPAAAPPPRARLERDGQPLDAARWQEGLAALDTQLAQNLARLLVTWEREAGVVEGRLQAEPAVLTGAAGLTWGWAEGPLGMAGAPYMRIEGLCDLLAWQLNLQLSGRLDLEGAQSRVLLHCSGTEMLQRAWQRGPQDTDLGVALQPVQCSFRQPFSLTLQTLATPELATLQLRAPVRAALVGRVGLRPHSAGAGLQWFAHIATEAVTAQLRVHDPLLGQQDLQRVLLPPQLLLDWSLA